MDDTIAWWDNPEVLKGGLSPLEEGEPLGIPLELELLIFVLGVGGRRYVNLDGMIDDQVNLA
jgi:hypothetical protein